MMHMLMPKSFFARIQKYRTKLYYCVVFHHLGVSGALHVVAVEKRSRTASAKRALLATRFPTKVVSRPIISVGI